MDICSFLETFDIYVELISIFFMLDINSIVENISILAEPYHQG